MFQKYLHLFYRLFLMKSISHKSLSLRLKPEISCCICTSNGANGWAGYCSQLPSAEIITIILTHELSSSEKWEVTCIVSSILRNHWFYSIATIMTRQVLKQSWIYSCKVMRWLLYSLIPMLILLKREQKSSTSLWPFLSQNHQVIIPNSLKKV